ncbi:MAG TPA: PSD1 and planctomycete cytochrome C domain-containing protein [Vicinamibacterales bacterium]|nr:PSD1 and planctomycete cytochrome C domain-containing protein [Vicinamibacterales bacterium]
MADILRTWIGRAGPTLITAVGLVAALSARQAQDAPAAPAPQAPLDAKSVEFFEARVRPVLVDNCYDCHAEAATAGLRLDSLDGLLKGGKSGPALVPGDPDASLLIKAIRHAAGAPKMPSGAPKLKDADISSLVEWVRAGAQWPAPTMGAAPAGPREKTITAEQRAFWSFQPIRTVEVPAVQDTAWPKNDIDRFVLARLEREGLKPVAAADKLTLLRRTTMDLTGLPPTPEEVDAFMADASPDAFAKVVDRLLASPQYGEAWGRHWLDVARYGEDDYRSLSPTGEGHDKYPNAYLYRDWVVRAINDDLPYDQFVKAQLAADLGDRGDRVRNLPALGFLGLGPWFYDNGAVEIMRADERHDRVDVVSRGLLGLTVGCARCHDHKYDPILTKDYYALAGVFLNTEYHEYPNAPKSIVDEYQSIKKKIEKKQELLGEFMSTESQQLAESLAFQASKYMQAVWKVTGEPKQDKNQVINSGKFDYELFDRWMYFLSKPPIFYPYLKDWQAMVEKGGTAAEAQKLGDAFQTLLVDVLLERRAVDEENKIIRAKALPGTKPKERANLPNEFKTNDDFCPGCGLELKSMPAERTALWNDAFAFNLEPDNAPGKPSKPALLRFNGWGLERQLSAERRQLIEALREDIKAMEKTLPAKYPYVHGVQDLGEPQDLNVSLRGNPFRLGDEVPRGYLTVLSAGERKQFSRGSGRLELAETIVSEPIFSRVIVNRIWKAHFGSGLVDTPSNFGANGERPSHPELLEYLAQYFIDHEMSMKALHREMLLSATYQLSADHDQKSFDVDSGNRLYWRANRRRMTAEQIRDSVLSVAGVLDTKLGGPSEPLTPLYTRRTLYGRISRYRLDEFLQLFDFPSPNLSAEKRFSTNVPLQRLFFMNSDFMQQHAEKLAARVANEANDDARIQKVYKILFGRAPTAAEVTAGKEFLRDEPMRQYEDRKAEEAKKKAEQEKAKPGEAKPADAETKLAPGADGMMSGVVPGAPRPADDKMLPVTTFGRYVKVLLSSNEFIFVN